MAETLDLGNRMRAGAMWIYALSWIESVVQFGSGIILARLLDPADFGVFVVASSYSAIVLLQVRFGIHSSLMQSASVDDDQWNSAFWFLYLMAFLCTIAMAVIALLSSPSYKDARYPWIMMLACVNYFFIPFQTINGTMLRRKLAYGVVSHIQIIALLVTAAFSITGAWAGMGPFSLVGGGIVGAIVSTILLYRVAPWKPKLAFSWRELKPLLRYGIRLHFNNSLYMLSGRVDNMIIGAIRGMAELGIYNRAINLSRMPLEQMVTKLYELFFVGFSRIKSDLRYSILMYRKILCAMSSVTFPMLLALLFIADGFVYHLYGAKWMDCVFPLKIMILGSFANLISTTLGALADAQKLAPKETPIATACVGMVILAVMLGSKWGLPGIAAGIAAVNLILLFLMQNMFRKSHIRIGWGILIGAVYPATLSTIIAGAGAWLVSALIVQRLAPENLAFMAIMCLVIISLYASSWFSIAWIDRQNVALQANADLFRRAILALGAKILGGTQSESAQASAQVEKREPAEAQAIVEVDRK